MLDQLNMVLKYKHTRIVLMLLFSVLAGNIVRPLPKMLDNLYSGLSVQSHVFKFIMLFILALLTYGPYNDYESIAFVAFSCFVVLLVLHLLREYEKRDDSKSA